MDLKVQVALYATIAYLAAALFIGCFFSKRVRGFADYAVAGRKLGLALAFGTILATWFGTGVAVGGASMAYSFGFRGVIMDPIGAGLCIILFGLFFAHKLRKMGYITVSDYFRERYGPRMELVSAVVQVVAYIGWTATLLVTFGTIAKVFLGISYLEGILIGGAVTLAYTMLGGMWSVAVTDLLQSMLLIAGVLILLPYTVTAVGGMSGVAEKVSLNDISILPESNWGYLGYFGLLGAAFYISSWLVQGMGSLSCQDLVQRALSAKDEATARRASIAAGLAYVTIGLVPAFIGILARFVLPGLDNPDEALPRIALQLLPTGAFAVFTVGLLAALMSSADSAMLVPAVMVAQNIVPFIKRVRDRTKLIIGRLMIPVVVVLALAIAMLAPRIYFLMNLSWELILMVQGLPFILGFYWEKAEEKGALASIAVNLCVWIALTTLLLPRTLAVEGCMEYAVWDAIYIAAPPALVAGLATFIVVSKTLGRRDGE